MSSYGPLIDDLYRLAALGQTFTEKRPKSGRSWGDLADALDREGMSFMAVSIALDDFFIISGVHLWNTSGLARQNGDSDEQQLVAACTFGRS